VHAPLMVCYGTRPQVVKASALLPVLRDRGPVVAVDTGQHYDYELNRLLYEQLGVEPPDHFLDVGSARPAAQTAAVMDRTAPLLSRYRPRAVIVIGDTNSTLGCGLAAAKEGVPLVHIEAGLRASDRRMAEELNRRIVDAASDLLCTPSAAADANLAAENIGGRVVRTGDISRDVLLRALERAPDELHLGDTAFDPAAPFILTTLHRAELVQDAGRTAAVVRAIAAAGLPVLFPAHPRTRDVLAGSPLPPAVRLTQPIGYLDLVALLRRAAVVVTDSGGLQREAYWLGVPCITVRDETEWVETVRLGANLLVPPTDPDGLAAAIRDRLDGGRPAPWPRDAYGAGDAALRIADAIRTLDD
jgi:UDP-GlcNAc3NAcA epimerase